MRVSRRCITAWLSGACAVLCERQLRAEAAVRHRPLRHNQEDSLASEVLSPCVLSMPARLCRRPTFGPSVGSASWSISLRPLCRLYFVGTPAFGLLVG
jgi:hypothetical protein